MIIIIFGTKISIKRKHNIKFFGNIFKIKVLWYKTHQDVRKNKYNNKNNLNGECTIIKL